MVIPTATNKTPGQGKLSLGPSAVVLVQPGRFAICVIVSNVWRVAGVDNRPAVVRMSLQYFISYILNDDWYVTLSPTIIADWRATKDDHWLIPVGVGIGKLVTIGKAPVDFSASIYANVVRPEGAPDWQSSLQATLLFPN